MGIIFHMQNGLVASRIYPYFLIKTIMSQDEMFFLQEQNSVTSFSFSLLVLPTLGDI